MLKVYEMGDCGVSVATTSPIYLTGWHESSKREAIKSLQKKLGDVFVTIIILAAQLGLDIEQLA